MVESVDRSAETQSGGPDAAPASRMAWQPGALPPPAVHYNLRLLRVMSFIVMTQRRTIGRSGSIEELGAFYREILIQNLLLGWWGIPFGLIWTPICLFRNRQAFQQLRTLASRGASAPGWFADPSGRHGARYWDGRAWTEQVRDTTTSTDSTGGA